LFFQQEFPVKKSVLAKWCGRLAKASRPRSVPQASCLGVPAFIIFHDSVLQEIAQRSPVTLEEFARIKGVGKKKTPGLRSDFCCGNRAPSRLKRRIPTSAISGASAVKFKGQSKRVAT
jgi:hypothetical protein